jgi:pyruvate kinase
LRASPGHLLFSGASAYLRHMTLPQFTRSKIVCTIGPASMSPGTLRAMAASGMDVARINTSHGETDEHRAVFEAVREIGGTSILVDLPGPKIRLGELSSSYMLEEGDVVHFTTEQVTGNRREMSVSYDRLPAEVHVGGHLFINDGVIDLEITGVDGDLKGFTGRVVSGGEVSSRKGLNAPGAKLTLKPPTEKDIKGIRFGVEMDCDWFAASFIRSARDMEDVRA